MGDHRQGAARRGIAAPLGALLAGVLLAPAVLAEGSGEAAPAVCPGPWDLEAGISALYADGSRNDFTAEADGMIRVAEAEAAAEGRAGFVALSRLGLYDVEIAGLDAAGAADPGRRLVTVYSEPAGTLPEPEQGGGWMGAMTTVWPDGSHETATAVYAFGRLRSEEFGPCRYDTVPVRASFIPWPEATTEGPVSSLDLASREPASSDWIAQEFLYFPTLRIAVLTVAQEAGVARLKRRVLSELRRVGP